jgi:hypothetical protein
VQGKTLVEIRSTGGYTVAPPSTHPSGDLITWEIEREPLRIEAEPLFMGVRNVGIGALLGIHWPGSGARHHAVAHMAGFLLRYGVEPPFVSRIIECAARAAHDPDLHDRINFVRATIAKFQSDSDACLTGGPKLAESLGDDVVARLRTWLAVADDDAIEDMNRKHFWTRMGAKAVIGREDDPSGVVMFQPVKELYSEYANRQIKVGEKATKDGDVQAVLKPLFQAWLESPNRRQFVGGVVMAAPPRRAPDNAYNLCAASRSSPHPATARSS